MGCCCSNNANNNAATGSNSNSDQNGPMQQPIAKSLLIGKIRKSFKNVHVSVHATDIEVSPAHHRYGDADARDKNGYGNRRGSDETTFHDCLEDHIDQFPSESGMHYPPAHTMRMSFGPIDFDKDLLSETLQPLLRESSRRTAAVEETREEEIERKEELQGNRSKSAIIVAKSLGMETSGTQGAGYPGELTEQELEICLAFRQRLKAPGNEALREMLLSMQPHEDEAFALCRFLRSREFVIEDTFEMLKESDQPAKWTAAKERDFYKELHKAPQFNGCPLPVFLTQFPLVHSGIGKNGAIILYFRCGKVNVPGCECVVGDMVNAIPFCWNQQYWEARRAMERESKCRDRNTTTVLAEKIFVVDFDGSTTLLSPGGTGLELIKSVGPEVSSCFPESNNRAYLINAPFAFSLVWSVVKRRIDERTMRKIGFFSSVKKAKSDFLDHVDAEELSSSYGGMGPSFEDIMKTRQKELAHKDGVERYVVEMLTTTSAGVGFDFTLQGNEIVDSIVVYSRSDGEAKISVTKAAGATSGSNNKRSGRADEKYVVDSATVSRTEATRVAAKTNSSCNTSTKPNYAVEIYTHSEESSTDDSSYSAYFVNATGTPKEHFLVAISIAMKRKVKEG